MLSLPRETLMVAPKESLLRSIIDGYNSDLIIWDTEGRIFLDLPPRPFKRIIDHLRMIHLLPQNRVVQPPVLDKQDEQEFWVLADLLGLRTFLMSAHAGSQQFPGNDGRALPSRNDSQDARNGCTLS